MIVTFSAIAWIVIAIVSFCIAIAPLLIWRNTNRTNRLIALLLTENGVDKNLISKSYYGSGDNIDYLEINKPKFESYEVNIPSPQPSNDIPVIDGFKECPACGTKCPANATRCDICPRVF